MDQNSNASPGLHLPQPSMGQQAFPPLPQAPLPQHPEVEAIVQPPQFTDHAPKQPAIQHYQPPVAPLPAAPAQPPTAQQPAPEASPAAPVVADTNDDTVDDEWINKARAIAEQYKGDPYTQSNALSKLKAEYLQARHGKIIKVNE